jgi:hypothetical protein
MVNIGLSRRNILGNEDVSSHMNEKICVRNKLFQRFSARIVIRKKRQYRRGNVMCHFRFISLGVNPLPESFQAIHWEIYAEEKTKRIASNNKKRVAYKSSKLERVTKKSFNIFSYLLIGLMVFFILFLLFVGIMGNLTK